MKPFVLRIHQLNHYGYGVAWQNDTKYLVPFVLPGELVQVKVRKTKGNVVYCDLLAVMEKSQRRVPAPCAVFGKCGGCDFQHMPYEDQLELKKQVVEKLFPNTLVHDVIPSPKEYEYRNRVTLHQEKGLLGFKEKNSDEIVAIQKCLIASPQINEKLKQRQESHLNQKKDLEFREDEMENAFIQVNTEQNENLKKLVCDLFQKNKRHRILELYSGTGNFSFDLSCLVKEIVVVEGNQNCVAVAEKKRQELSVKNMECVCLSVEKAVTHLLENYKNFDAILCDPPREGLRRVARLLPRFTKVKKIVYVSCNPKTLKKDVAVMMSKGFVLKEVWPIDMFPQTHHIEVVAVLEL